MSSRAEALIDAVLLEACTSGALPGVVAMAASARGVFYEGAFGSADLSSAAPMRTDAVFRIASMTKALTAAAAMQLVERGCSRSMRLPERSCRSWRRHGSSTASTPPANRFCGNRAGRSPCVIS